MNQYGVDIVAEAGRPDRPYPRGALATTAARVLGVDGLTS
jgi:hypothetical protein